MQVEIGTTIHTDPVCGMEIDESQTAGTSEYLGKTYYFCSTACKEKFDENPDEYTEETGDR
jgi:YHS domain-containing protein